MTVAASAVSRIAITLIAMVLLAGSATAERTTHAVVFTRVAPSTAARAAPLSAAPVTIGTRVPVRALAVPAALTKPGLDLRAGPVAVPLRLRIPSIGLDVAVIGVGLTPGIVMDAPFGPPDDPVWQEAFWYRGSAVPGARSTALIAGHIDDPLGRPGTFAHIDRLVVGAVIIVHDTRNGLDVRFAVTGSHSYPLDETTDPAVLTQMYGAGPVAGGGPTRSADGLAHLTLVTCAGVFDHSIETHDRRLVVTATRLRP